MGFLSDLTLYWALGAIFWVTLHIFSQAYTTLWRFFGKIFDLRGKIHYGLHRMLFNLFRIPSRNQGSDKGLIKTIDSGSVVSQSPIRAFLVTCAPLLCGTGVIYAIRMYLGNGTQERLYIQIGLIVVLLIAIFPSKQEQLFVLRTLYTAPFRTLQDSVILFGVWLFYVTQFAWVSQWPFFGSYFFEFGVLLGGFFLAEGVIWGLGKGIHKWDPAQRNRNKPLKIPKAVIQQRTEAMFPERRPFRIRARTRAQTKARTQREVKCDPLEIPYLPQEVVPPMVGKLAKEPIQHEHDRGPRQPHVSDVLLPLADISTSKSNRTILTWALTQCVLVDRKYGFVSKYLLTDIIQAYMQKYGDNSRRSLDERVAELQEQLSTQHYIRTKSRGIGREWRCQQQIFTEKTQRLCKDQGAPAMSPPALLLSLPPLVHRSQQELEYSKWWIPVIEITQNPLVASTLVSEMDRNKPVACPETDVWAKNFSGELARYGIEFGEKTLRYFLPSQFTRINALTQAEDLLTRLRTRYPGINGTCTVRPIVSKEASQLNIWTLRGDTQISSRYGERLWYNEDRKKIPQIKIISAFLHELRFLPIDLRCIILYKQQQQSRANVSVFDRPTPPIELELYFVYVAKPGEDSGRFSTKIRTMLESLTKHNFEDYENPCRVIKIRDDMINLVWQHIWTSHRYGWFSPAFVINSTQFDFSYPRNVKNMAQSYIFPGENVPVLRDTESPQDYLDLGYILNYGARTDKMAIIPFLKLQEHVGIFGATGTGKTYFYRWILSELNRKRPQVGVLILNLAKKKQAGMYRNLVDVVLTYGEDSFEIPYLTTPTQHRQRRSDCGTSTMGFQRTAQILLAALDLRDPYVEVASQILADGYAAGHIPATLDDLFTQISTQVQRYGKDTNLNMAGILENRRGIFKDPLLLEMTRYRDGKCGSWFDWFLDGASIFLDLSPCQNSYSQQLLVMLILLTIYFKAEELPPEQPQIKNVLLIDEAHRFLTKNPQSIRDSATADIKIELLTQYLSENRSRGFAMMLGDQAPTKLLDAAHQEVGTRITFNIKEHAAHLFYADYEKRNIIQHLPARCAHVQYGEKSFLIETPDLASHSLCPRVPHPPPTAAGEWFYLHLLLDPFYVHPDIVDNQWYVLLSKKVGVLQDQGRFSAAFSLVYSIWNHLLRDVITKNSDFSPSPKDLLFPLLFRFGWEMEKHKQALHRSHHQWTEFRQALGTKDPLTLSEDDVRTFYSDLQGLCHYATLSLVESHKQEPSVQSGEMQA